jgi:hydroxymethylpyrimidine/phosphomethylpyrimidine kinase
LTDGTAVKDLAKSIARLGPPYVLLKGGHLENRDDIFDVLYDAKADKYTMFRHKCAFACLAALP